MAETTAKRNYRWRDEKFYARVANSIANRVNSYQEKYNALQSDYQKRNAGRKYTYEDAYVSDSADWADSVAQRRSELDAEADSISAYIDRFTDGLDANWVKQIKSGLTDTKKYQGMMADAATKDHEWWSNFENAEAYQYAGRADGYSKKYSGMTHEQLQKAFADLGDGEERQWLQYNQGDIYGAGLRNQSDFQQYSQKGAGLKYDDFSEAEQMDLLRDGKEYIAAVAAVANHYGTETVRSAEYEQYSALFDMMDEEEFQVLAYCIAKDKEEGTSLTQQYLSSVEKDLENRRGKAIGNNIKGTPVLADLYAVNVGLTNFANGFKTLMGLDTGYGAGTTQVAGNTIRESFANDGFKLPDWMGGASARQALFDLTSTTANQLPSIAVSSMLSVLNPTLGAVAGTTLMGGSAAGNAYSEAIDKGYGENEAKIYGAGIGILEGSLQYALGGISKLGGAGPRISKAVSGINSGLARFALQWGGSMVSEGIEEGLQEVLDPILQNAILGEDENVDWGEVAYSALLGALSAGTLELGGTISKTRAQTALNNEIVKQYGSLAETLIQEGLESGDGSVSQHLAKKYQKQQAKGKNLSSSQVLEMLTANAESRLSKLGETKNISRVAELAVKYTTGQEMTRTEKSMLAKSQYGAQVAKDLRVSAQAYNLAKQMETLSEATYKPLEERVGNVYTTSESGQAVIHDTNKTVSLDKAEVVEVGADGMTLRVDGEEVSTDDIDFADDSQSYLYSAVSKIENITPGAATAIIKDYDPASGQTVGAYLNGVDEAFTYGFHGYTKADLMAGDYTVKLTDVQRNSAYVLGQSARKIADDAKVAKHKKMRTATEAEAEKKAEGTEKSSATVSKKEKVAKQKTRLESDDTEVYFQDGKSTVKFDEHTGKYDEKRMAAVNYAKFLSKLGIGGKYFFYESYVKDGKRYYKDANGNEVEAPNGMYMEGNGSIHIDMNAGNYGQGTTLFTLGHEITHFIKEWSPDKFKVLADFLIEEYGKTDMTMHERVLAKQNKLSEIRGKSVSYNEAFEEVVADAMSTMFTDGNLHEKLAKLRAKDKRLFNKIKQFFEKLVAKFRGVYAELTPEQKDAQDVRAMKDAFDKIQTAFAEALVEASENFQAEQEVQKNTTEDGGVDAESDIKLSPREENAFKPYAQKINAVVNQSISGKGNIDGKAQVKDIMPTGPRITAMVAASSGNAIDISQRNIALSTSDIWHEFKRHTSVGEETSRGQIAFTKRQFQNAVKCIISPDMVETIFADTNNPTQRQSFAYAKKTARGHYVVVEAVGGKNNPQIYPVMIVQFSKAKWNKMMAEGKSLGEILHEGEPKKLLAQDVEKNKKSRVTAAQFASYEAIANTLHSPQLDTKVSQPDAEVNSESTIRNSDRDSQGNKLTKEQQGFFKDSKIVDANGNLKVMYHGSQESFTVFDKKKARSSGYYGKGFYFTDSNSHAKQYGNAYEVYLNITHPLQNGTKDITKEQFRKFVEAIAENEDYGLDNYGERATVDSVTNSVYGKGDFAMLMDINASCVGDLVAAVELFNEVNGTDYDGIIAPTETVAFHPEQIKRTDNKAPTSNPDMRFSERNADTAWADIHSRIFDLQSEEGRLNRSVEEFEASENFKSVQDRMFHADSVESGVNQYLEWREKSGYGSLLAQRDAVREELKKLREERDNIYANESAEKEQQAIARSGLSEADYFRKQAVKEFGYTPYFYDAGYLTPNGKMLNFSGEKGKHFGSRGEDHRAIGIIYENTQGSNAMVRFMNDGNIRIMAETPGLDISSAVEPTSEQYATIRKFARESTAKGYFAVDISDENGRVIGNYEYDGYVNADRVVNDIKYFFEHGEVREQSSVARFLNSDRNYERDSTGKQITKEQQEFFKDSQVRDKKGNLLVVYHGTTANFNIFKKGDVGFHFGTKGAARGRAGFGKNVNIKAVYLNITNPIVFDEDLGSWDADYRLTRELYDRGILTMDEAMSVLHTDDGRYKRSTEAANKKLADVLIAKGYDGITYQNTFETKKATTSYIAFSSNQAKEITNLSPTTDPDIRYSYRGVNKDGIEVYETSQDVKNLTRKERQQQFLDIMTNEYRGRTAKFIRNGHTYYATFEEKDVNKNIYGDKRSDKKGYKAKINVGADGDIFELVENAQYNGSHPEKGKKITAHRGVGYWDYFIKNVQIDGTVFNLTANVRKKADGAFVYSIQLNENKKIKASPPLGLLSKALNGVTNASNKRITQPASKVNSQNSGTNSERGEDTSNRALLANAFEGITQNSEEYKLIQEYKGRIRIINEYEEDLAKINAEIRKMTFGTEGQRDPQRLKQLQAEAKKLAESINRNDKKLLSLEASEPLRKVIERERKKEAQKTKEHVKEIRQKMKESAAVKEKRAMVERAAKALMDMLAHPTKDAHVPTALHKPLQEFLEAIDFSSQTQLSGKGMTIRDVAYTRALTEVRAAIAGQRSAMDGAEDGTFELDIPDSFLKEIDDHIRVINSATKGLDLTTNRVYEMNSDELADLGYMLRTINKAIRHIDKLHMAGAKARVSQLGRDTRLEMSKRKPVKGESGGKAMWANFTPWHAFRRMGKAAQQIFKGLMQGQSKLARTIASVIQFAEKTYTAKEAKAWEHKKHTIELDSGKTITMTPAQIMSFYCLSKRQHAKGHMMGGGIRIGTIKNDVKDSVQEHAKELVQKEHYTLTEQDIINIISHLTDRQISVAEALQQYMQNVGGRLNNEISMARWDYMAATEDNYFPIKTDDSTRDVKDPGQEKSNLWALLNKSFTKGLTPGANNAMVVESIFDVFADHMSEVAEYNAFALPLVDAMKWFNYRERIKLDDTHIKDVGVQKSIRDALGTSAVKYFVDLMTDINSSQKAGRHENLAGQILSRSKVASVGWNLRVAIQQPTAILRASLILDAPSLLKGTIRIGTKKLVKEMQQYSGIALWKSMGYYDLNVSRNVREQIKGDDSLMDKFNELGMWLPGKMDEITWARIWAATKAKVAKEQKLSGEDLLQATAELFEEVVYQTQVADSVLTRSSLMRSKTQFMKEATSFMAEPTASVNILLSAFQDYEDGRTTWGKVKRGLAIGFFGYALSASANAIATSLMDAWRDDDEHEEYWEKFVQALLGEKNFLDGNLFSEMNPLEKIVFVRDFISLMKGYDVAPGYADLFQSGIDLVTNYKNFVEGRGSITAYGIVYQTLQVLGNVSGFGASNITREVAGVWNNTIGKLYPDLLLHRYDAGVQNEIRNAYNTGALTYQETVQLLIDNGVVEDEDDAYWTIQKWANGSDYSKYKAVFEAVRNGQSIDEAMEELTSHGHTEKDVRSQIKSQIGKWYQDKAITKQQAIAMLTEYTEMDEEEVTARVEYWDFCDAHPDCDLSESKVGDYKEFAEPANISLEVFERFVEETKGLEDIKDEWGDVETSKRDQVLAVIDSLPLTWEQKDALYLAAGYAESKIWDVPW